MWWNTNLCVTGSGRRLFFLCTTTDDISQDSETCCLPASIESILMVLLILLLLAIMGITISSPPRLLSLFLQMLLTSVVGGIMCSIHRNSRGNFRNANQKIRYMHQISHPISCLHLDYRILNHITWSCQKWDTC